MITRHCRIYGRVQGVSYRQSLQQVATGLGLTSWIRNRRDGSVEATVCGNETDISKLIEWAKQGPAMAKVMQVVVSDTTQPSDTDIPSQTGFVILPTA
ncbi:MAG TPA: acylphosphatase [Methylophilaceae bacterium]|jgi:acylphosphatase